MTKFKSYKGVLDINLAALRENYRIFKNRVDENVRVAASVKANAYGLGALEVVGALIKEGARDFYVANLDEACALRAHYKDIKLYILNGYFENYAQNYLDYDLIPMLDALPEIEQFRLFSKKHGGGLKAALHFNMRMNRLGLSASEQSELVNNPDLLSGLDIVMISSHFACADEADHPMNVLQRDLFAKMAANFPNATACMANSSAVFLGNDYHFDMVKPGASLYGVNPTPCKPNPMKAVVSLKAPIIKTRTVYKDAVIGYNTTYKFEKDTAVATVGVGYADGLLRSLSNQGGFYWNGIRCPIRGRVSMDLISVDLSAVPESLRPKQGDYLEILGEHQSVDELGHDAGTIGYEILTSLGDRYERIYKD